MDIGLLSKNKRNSHILDFSSFRKKPQLLVTFFSLLKPGIIAVCLIGRKSASTVGGSELREIGQKMAIILQGQI